MLVQTWRLMVIKQQLPVTNYLASLEGGQLSQTEVTRIITAPLQDMPSIALAMERV